MRRVLRTAVCAAPRRHISSAVFHRYTAGDEAKKGLSYADFRQLVLETGVMKFSEDGVKGLFDKIDKDGNGTVDRTEFLSWFPEVQERYRQSSSPLAAYDCLVASGEVRFDAGQLDAIQQFQRVHDDLVAYVNDGAAKAGGSGGGGGLFSSFFGSSGAASKKRTLTEVEGLYLYGGVGCGKSFMMDLFFEKIPVERKRRVHFNQFMLDVHKRMAAAKKEGGAGGALDRVARDISNEVELLCFDEFQVTDIGDAMIVMGLFERLYEHGLCMIATSNRPPSDLYEGGLNRHKFFPFIATLRKHTHTHAMKTETDYRRENPPLPNSVYHAPNDAAAQTRFDEIVGVLTEGNEMAPSSVRVFGRDVPVPRAHAGVAVFTFSDLCDQAMSAADFGAICHNHHTVCITNIPKMTFHQRTQARRFIYLVDEMYERRCKIVCTAAAQPDDIFSGEAGMTGEARPDESSELRDALGMTDLQGTTLFTGAEEVFAFGRAVSRLNEMQTREYLTMPHCELGLPAPFRTWVDSLPDPPAA
eukprot:Rhum_TRINITY_DN14693_c0_g1::Rhum_TRINITY_DN14693_c0_g1_i2::g.107856::m.107856/K18798/AFG1, LACE1; peroxisome-assembly ATPase